MMSNKVLLSLATVALFVATAQAYTVETTTNWFSVVAADVSLTDNWGPVKPTRGDEATVIDVDTSAAAPAKYTPAESKPTATRYRVTGSMKVTLNAGVPSDDVFGETVPKAALVAVAGDPNKWYAWYTNDVSAAWVPMSGVDAPAEGTTYTITIEFTSTTVSYKVNGTQLETTGEPPSSTLGTVEGTSIASVGLAGFGSFGDFSAVGYEEFEVIVSTADIEPYGLGLADLSDAAAVKAALDAIGDNGYPKWQSIVLGLKDSASQPYLAPVQNTDSGKVTLSLGGVSPKEGYNVTYEVETYDRLDGDTTGTTGNIDAIDTVDVTPGDSAVKYYKIKIKITK